MKNHIRALIPITLLTTLVFAGPEWREDEDGGEDAGSTPGAAQSTTGVGGMAGVSGRLDALSGTPFNGPGLPDDFQDVYIICIDDPAAFRASTEDDGGFAEFDIRLSLFTLEGVGILSNNDPTPVMSFGDGNGNGSTGATLLNPATDATGSEVTASGLYLLAVTTAPFIPLDGNGDPIFFFEDPHEVSGPDGPGSGPFTQWDDGEGACCAGGECFTLTEAQCETDGGAYQGDDVGCDEVVCEVPVGACIITDVPEDDDAGDDGCLVTTADACEQMGGVYQGDGTECPATGACITQYKGSEDCFITTEDDCLSQGGEYQGDDSVCPATGACILLCPQSQESPVPPDCFITTEDDCENQGGEYQGDDTMCDGANNFCENATAIGAGTYAFDTTGATTDGSAYCDVPCATSTGSTGGDCGPEYDLWYTYVAPDFGTLTASTCNDANFDTVISVYDGCECPASNCITCEDDTSGCWLTTAVSVSVQGGTCYMIRVGGYDETGTGNLTISFESDDAQAPFTPTAYGGETAASGEGDTPELDGEYRIIFEGVCFASEVPMGACELPDGGCVVTTEFECLRALGAYQGDDTACADLYRLHNHPDANTAPPSCGLRLDELWDATESHDVFTFDFDHPGAEMYMTCDGTTIHIFGVAFGGRDRGLVYDALQSGYVDIDFVYDIGVQTAPGDDDKIVIGVDGANGGWLQFQNLSVGAPFPFHDYSGNFGYQFRFGDEDDDLGHRGFDGLSGWGWLLHPDPDSLYIQSSDWLFTAELVNDVALEPAAPVANVKSGKPRSVSNR